MTLNIWNYTPPWSTRRQLIADLIGRHQPDVVALQESRRDFRFERGKGQAEQIAALTGYHSTSAVAQVYVPVLRVDEGLAILTRGEPVRTAARQLTPRPKEREDENGRICLAVTVEVGEQHVHVFDTHFSLSPKARVDNAREVMRFVREWSEDEPAVLAGDLNDEPDSTPVRYLTGAVAAGDEGGDLSDCWRTIHAAEPGFTYASWHPWHRIDYVLARKITAVKSASIVGGESKEGVYPSDHLGMVVEIEP